MYDRRGCRNEVPECWSALLTDENVALLSSTLDSIDSKDFQEEVKKCRPPPVTRTVAPEPASAAASTASAPPALVIAPGAAGSASASDVPSIAPAVGPVGLRMPTAVVAMPH